MGRIRNLEDITNHGNIKGRKMVADIMETALLAGDPYKSIFELAHREGSRLIFDCKDFEALNDPNSGAAVYDLSEFDRVYVFAIGKGIQRMAKALEDLIGEYLTDGHVIGKHGDELILEKLSVTLAGHPVPDRDCVIGTQKIVDMIKNARLTDRDLVITAIGNGVSSLCTLPVPEIPFEDIMETTRLMQIEYGVRTHELNQIRNNVDQLKGGRITRLIQPAKSVHLLGISIEAIPWRKDSTYEDIMRSNMWLHTIADGTSPQEALAVIEKWDTEGKFPRSVVEYFKQFKPENSPVRYEEFKMYDTRVFGTMPKTHTTLPAAVKRAEQLGFHAYILSDNVYTNARCAGEFAAQVARSCEANSQPFQVPCAFFTSGEVTTVCGGTPGIGGCNQEFCLAGSFYLQNTERCVMAAIDTDGTDGPGGDFHLEATARGITNLAGGIVDGYSYADAVAKGIDVEKALSSHASSHPLWEIGSALALEQGVCVDDFTCTLILSDEMLGK